MSLENKGFTKNVFTQNLKVAYSREPTAFPLADRIGIVAITHNNLHRVHGDKGPPGGEPLSPIDD